MRDHVSLFPSCEREALGYFHARLEGVAKQFPSGTRHTSQKKEHGT